MWYKETFVIHVRMWYKETFIIHVRMWYKRNIYNSCTNVV